MANEIRQYANGVGGIIDTQVDTSAGGSFLLSSPALAVLPAIDSAHHVMAALDPWGSRGGAEYVKMTAHPATSLSSPTGLTVTPTGAAGTTTYGYRITALVGIGETLPCAEVTTTTGNAALSGANYNALAWTAVPGATGYRVYGRTAGGELLITTVTTNSYNDTGTLAPAGALPTVSTALNTMATFTAAQEGSSGRVHYPDEVWSCAVLGSDLGSPRPIAQVTLAAASPNIDFSNIPQGFTHLLLKLSGASDAAVYQVPVNVTLNGDSAAHYAYDLENFYNAGTAAAVGGSGVTQTSMGMALIPAASSGAGVSGSADIDFQNYKGTTLQKAIRGAFACFRGLATAAISGFATGGWNQTAAINEITLTPGSGNFVAGTVATLYGVN